MCNAVLFFFVSREIRSTLAAAPKTDNSKSSSKEFKVYLSIFFSIGLVWFFAFLVLLVPNPKAQGVRAIPSARMHTPHTAHCTHSDIGVLILRCAPLTPSD